MKTRLGKIFILMIISSIFLFTYWYLQNTLSLLIAYPPLLILVVKVKNILLDITTKPPQNDFEKLFLEEYNEFLQKQ